MSAIHGFGYCESCSKIVDRVSDSHLFCVSCGAPLLCPYCECPFDQCVAQPKKEETACPA